MLKNLLKITMKKKHLFNSLKVLLLSLTIFGCKQEAKPKPEGYLRLEYPENSYHIQKTDCNFQFEKNAIAQFQKERENCQYTVLYPSMKASIYLNYKQITNNLDYLLKDAQKLTYNHTVKAEEIIETPFINPNKRVYGMFYNVTGNAATNIQFYATDSVKNFVVGTLYFYAKPHYDSIYPATKYIEKDMKQLLETIEWQ